MVTNNVKQAVVLALHVFIGLSAAGIIPEPSHHYFHPKASTGYKGGVASETSECSRIGTQILSQGGNAVDAMVATTFCVGVIGMYHSGVGGGGFMVVRDDEGEYEAIDFRESAPAAAYENMYEGNVNGSVIGGLAAGVPGEVAGLEYVHEKYGSLPWKTCMEGAIEVARDGFIVSGDLVDYIGRTLRENEENGNYNFLLEDPVWAEEFAPNGTLIEIGDIMTRPRYARTLERIANEGSSAFYFGEIGMCADPFSSRTVLTPSAESMIKTIQSTNGTMTLDDLANYNVVSRKVHKATFRNHTLHTIGSPANGPVTLNILKAMEHIEPEPSLTELAWHRYVEAMRFGYSARLKIGDPVFVDGVDKLEGEMVTDETAKRIAGLILDNTTMPIEYYDPEKIYTADSHGTSHISTADASGMAVSLTTTVNLLFGAQIMDPLSGIIINNEMNDFSIPNVSNEFGFPPSEANFIRPFKRPLSSCTPIIAERPDGSLLVSVGAAGGSRIVSSTAQTLWHTIDHGMSLSKAVGQPRIHDQLMPNHILTEHKFDNDTVEALREKGHEIKYTAPQVSIVHGVWMHEDGTFEAAADPRQGNSAGMTVGYEEAFTVQQ